VHWKEGGHKQECKALQAVIGEAFGAGDAHGSGTSSSTGGPTAPTAEPERSAATTSRPTHVTTANACEDGACIICLCDDPSPIQSGCACRGDAGLAHVECRAEAAAHRMANIENCDGWWKCGTCGQNFTGAMQLGLAEAYWSSAQRLPDENGRRLDAAINLADAKGKHGEAATIYREKLAVQQRVLGADHPRTLNTANNLAGALYAQGKYSEAATMIRETFAVKQRVLGADHPSTLRTATNLADALRAQGNYGEAETMYRETLAIEQRVLGSEHPSTLTTASNLALTLHYQAFILTKIQQRVLGSEHPDTLATANNLAVALRAQGKYSEAETMYCETLAVQRRVLGPEHPSTLNTANNLAECVRSARADAAQ
jgi:tetratricopeptide (TPR) repeat protein